METMGSRLKRLREARGLSQGVLAKRAGLKSQGAIGNIERDTRGYGASIIDIARELQTTPEYLRLEIADVSAPARVETPHLPGFKRLIARRLEAKPQRNEHPRRPATRRQTRGERPARLTCRYWAGSPQRAVNVSPSAMARIRAPPVSFSMPTPKPATRGLFLRPLNWQQHAHCMKSLLC